MPPPSAVLQEIPPAYIAAPAPMDVGQPANTPIGYEHLLSIQQHHHMLVLQQKDAEIRHLRARLESMEVPAGPSADARMIAALQTKDEEVAIMMAAKHKELELMAGLLQLREQQIDEFRQLCEAQQLEIQKLKRQTISPMPPSENSLPSGHLLPAPVTSNVSVHSQSQGGGMSPALPQEQPMSPPGTSCQLEHSETSQQHEEVQRLRQRIDDLEAALGQATTSRVLELEAKVERALQQSGKALEQSEHELRAEAATAQHHSSGPSTPHTGSSHAAADPHHHHHHHVQCASGEAHSTPAEQHARTSHSSNHHIHPTPPPVHHASQHHHTYPQPPPHAHYEHGSHSTHHEPETQHHESHSSHHHHHSHSQQPCAEPHAHHAGDSSTGHTSHHHQPSHRASCTGSASGRDVAVEVCAPLPQSSSGHHHHHSSNSMPVAGVPSEAHHHHHHHHSSTSHHSSHGAHQPPPATYKSALPAVPGLELHATNYDLDASFPSLSSAISQGCSQPPTSYRSAVRVTTDGQDLADLRHRESEEIHLQLRRLREKMNMRTAMTANHSSEAPPRYNGIRSSQPRDKRRPRASRLSTSSLGESSCLEDVGDLNTGGTIGGSVFDTPAYSGIDALGSPSNGQHVKARAERSSPTGSAVSLLDQPHVVPERLPRRYGEAVSSVRDEKWREQRPSRSYRVSPEEEARSYALTPLSVSGTSSPAYSHCSEPADKRAYDGWAYRPHPSGDPTDAAIATLVNRPGRYRCWRALLCRLDEGLYLCGTRKLHLRVDHAEGHIEASDDNRHTWADLEDVMRRAEGPQNSIA